MVRVWTITAPRQVPLRIPTRRLSLVLCLGVLGAYPTTNAFHPNSQNQVPSSHNRINGGASSTGHSIPLPPPDDDPLHGIENPVPETLEELHGVPDGTANFGNKERQGSPFGSIKRATESDDPALPPNRRSLRLRDTLDAHQTRALSHIDPIGKRGKNDLSQLREDSDGKELDSQLPSVAETGKPSEGQLSSSTSESQSQREEDKLLESTKKEHDSSLEKSAGTRLALERPRNFAESISIPSPLAHSLLYRTRDIANPLNLANFLAEGQEWIIPGSGSLWEGLGRRVDSLFSGLFLKTASILPDYKRNVIICYKDFKPSMWIEMFGFRNQFLRQLASLFQGTLRMQSVYLRNLGMEIFEVPPLWQVGEFVATVLKLNHFVSHVYTDHLVTDFDQEAQEPFQAEFLSRDQHSKSKQQHEHVKKKNTADNQHQTYSQDATAPSRRLDIMTNDPYTWQQWAIVDSGPSRWGIEAPTAWEAWTGLGLKPRFTVAVIDSGVDYEHPDLKNQIWKNPDEICGNGIDDDFNGFIDDCIGWDFVKGTNLPMDENGHGTASAGIIAAEPNNGIGLTGVCWGCEILVLKALNEDIKGTISAFARSLDYAIGKGVMLSNNSYGGRGSGFRGLEEAVQRARQAGMIVVAAAGNYNGNNDNDKQPVFPASYDLDNIVSVAAISRNGQLAPFSSYGKKQVDVAAPGANIMTTSAQRSYRTVSGTSFAVPMVTGTIALLWTRRPHLTYRQVIQRLLRSVKKSPHLEGLIATGGTIDAWRTLANEDLLDPYAASPVLPVTCASAPCSSYATCTDVQGTARCVCNRGFQGDGKFCTDIDECIFSPCGPASVCVNTVGSYQCKCRKGFQQTPEACIDIDECTLGKQSLIPQPCPPQAKCCNFSGTFDCICPFGAVWNGLSGPNGQCLKINSPSRGPCERNGSCGMNALCQAVFSPTETTRKCGCVSGFKPLRMDNQEVATALANSQMSSFDNTVCIREDILPEEQAYYLISMHRERMRSLRESTSGQTPEAQRLPSNGMPAVRVNPNHTAQPAGHYRSPVTAQPAAHYGSPGTSTYIPTPYAAASINQASWSESAASPILPSPSTVNVLYGAPPAQIPGTPAVPVANYIQASHQVQQPILALPKGSCLLGVCFR